MELIYTALWLSPFVIAALVIVLCFVAVIGSSNDFRVGVWMIACTYVLDAISMSSPLLYVGLMIYTADLPMVLVASAAAIRWFGAKQMPRRHPAWLLFALAFMASLFLGLMIHGTSAGVQARPDFNALAAASYALSFPIRRPQLRAMLVALAWAALMLTMLSIYRWTVTYADITSLLPPSGSFTVDGSMRVLNSNAALLITQVALVGVFFFGSGLAPLLARMTAPALLMVALALQHRSVWLAGLVAASLSMLLARSSRAPWWQQAILLSVAVVAVVAPLVLSDSLLGQVQSSATRAVKGEGTVLARFENWRATVHDWVGEGPAAIAVGSPPGGQTTRIYDSETGKRVAIAFGTHNNYLHMLTSHGLLGLAMWSWVVGLGLIGLWRARRLRGEPAEMATMLLVLLCSQLVYYIAYDVDYVQALIMGTVLAWVFQHQRETAGVVGAVDDAPGAPAGRAFDARAGA
jgi:hypothetical protein